jgi:hypothetical protein
VTAARQIALLAGVFDVLVGVFALARQGIGPQVAQRIMRHSDYRTTAKHYVRLELTDTAAAVGALPSLLVPQQLGAEIAPSVAGDALACHRVEHALRTATRCCCTHLRRLAT